jgi:adenylate cyclase
VARELNGPDVHGDGERKLAAIVALDVAGYAARTEANDAEAAFEIAHLRTAIQSVAGAHGGRIFNAAGDSFMLEFASGVGAVAAAVDLAESCEPKVRVGVHLGDVIVQANGDLLGHGINIAARLMAQSEPGSVLLSGDIRRAVRGPIGDRFVPFGALRLDKMTETVEAHVLQAGPRSDKRLQPLLAVLPFDNLCDGGDMQFLSDGIADEILRAVARAEGVRTIGRSFSFQYRGVAKATRKVARELNATHVLDGAVQRAGDRIRVTAHLVDTSSLATIWADRFDRETTDALKLQDEIATAIVDALKGKLTHVKAKSIEPAAYDLYLQARAELAEDYAKAHIQRASELLARAVTLAPDFAKAWGLYAHMRASLLDRSRSDAAVADVRAVAERALKLDAECPEAYAALAMLTPPFAHHDERLRLAARALELAPADPWVVCAHANALWSTGKIEEALTQWECAAPTQALSPQYIAVYAQLLLAADRTDQALAVIEDAWPLFRRSRAVWQARFDILSRVAPWEEADQMLTPGAPLPYGLSSSEATHIRDVRTAARLPRAAREQALRDVLQREPTAIEDCLVAANAGEPGTAFEAISRALAGRSLTTRLDFESPGPGPSFHSFAFFTRAGEMLRTNPAFSSLADRMGLSMEKTAVSRR